MLDDIYDLIVEYFREDFEDILSKSSTTLFENDNNIEFNGFEFDGHITYYNKSIVIEGTQNILDWTIDLINDFSEWDLKIKALKRFNGEYNQYYIELYL